jgi:PAS domain S-box-containing protein
VRLETGVIYDGRAVIASLCGLFFGPVAASIAAGMGCAWRIIKGGDGMLAGVLMIVVSAALGIGFHYRTRQRGRLSTGFLLWFGYVVQLSMLVLIFMLPRQLALEVFRRVAWVVLLAYPATTVLMGRLLSDQQARLHFVAGLDHRVGDLQAMFQSMPEGVIATNGRGRIERLNAEAERLTGWPNGEALDRPLAEVLRIVNQRTREEVTDPQGEILRHGHLLDPSEHYLLVSRSGRRQPVTQAAARIRSHEGQGGGVVVALRQETADQRAQREMVERERRFRTIVESGRMLVWTSGMDRLFDYFNGPWLAFTGRELEQEIGQGWLESVHAEDHQAFLRAYYRAFEKRLPFHLVLRLRRHDGEYRRLLGVAAPRLDADGTFLGYVGQWVDVTEPLGRQERQEMVFHGMAAGLGICRTVRDGAGMPIDYWFVDANPAFERLMGVRGADLLERPICEAIPDIGTEWLETYQQVALTGTAAQFAGTVPAGRGRLLVMVHRPLPNQLATVLVDLSARGTEPGDKSGG